MLSTSAALQPFEIVPRGTWHPKPALPTSTDRQLATAGNPETAQGELTVPPI